jgi:hypothetical protein
MVFFSLWFYVCLIEFGKLFNVCKTVDEERMLCVEWMPVQFIEGIYGCVGVSEFDKGISMQARLDKLRIRCEWTHPWLFPVLSFHGMEISSGLMTAPFRVNSFVIFAKSFSSFDLSMVGTPSTTRM